MVARPLRSDWEIVKDDMMREALHAKFDQHPALMSLLLKTVDADFVEQRSTTAIGRMTAMEREKTAWENY